LGACCEPVREHGALRAQPARVNLAQDHVAVIRRNPAQVSLDRLTSINAANAEHG
jgi:hypothetical protein